MKHLKIRKSPVELGLKDFNLKGEPVIYQQRALKDIASIFLDQEASELIPSDTVAYHVQTWMPVPDGTQGGLSFGTSTIRPGKVGNEYFMTKGHFHSKSDRAEFYWGVQGKGMLILMDRDRNTWAEEVYPGSLHYIGGEIAHRLANTGSEDLVVGACWPSDAGHNYHEIAMNGFSARLLEIDGKPILIDCEK
ncbi:MAG TPA: glucose-6-phosphate isomerase family protein [Prolixibacteraceae bacterium]|nr:glucose-6-phosphate isomerase family protein [Prolixibacteraceae bacterium]